MHCNDNTISRRSMLQGGMLAAGGALAAGMTGCLSRTTSGGKCVPDSTEGRATVSIMDFGARATLGRMDPKTFRYSDETDNAPAIQRAIDSLPPFDEETGEGGGVVHVPRGSFVVAQTVYLKPGVVLRGEGFFSGPEAASQFRLPAARWQDRAHPHPIVETRHPDGPQRAVPGVGIENLEISAFPRELMYGVLLKDANTIGYPAFQEVLDERASRMLNPGAILCVWRGGPGSFMRNVNFVGGPGCNQTPWSARYAVVIPPECHAGPSVWDGLCFECCWRQVLMEHAHDIVMFSCSWGCFDAMNQPWLELKNCTGIVMHSAAAESPFHLVAESSQAVVYGGWSGWAPDAPPLFELKNSDIAIHDFQVMNCERFIEDTWNGDTFKVAGPGGGHGKNDKTDYLAFYSGRGAVIPGGGKGTPRGFAAV